MNQPRYVAPAVDATGNRAAPTAIAVGTDGSVHTGTVSADGICSFSGLNPGEAYTVIATSGVPTPRHRSGGFHDLPTPNPPHEPPAHRGAQWKRERNRYRRKR